MEKEKKLILFHGFSEDESRFLLRLIKGSTEGGSEIAFCMSTPVNKEWKLKDLIADVTEEHAYMVDLENKNREKRDNNS